MTTVADVAAWMESVAPLRLAASWDNVGLLLGEATAPVERVLTCLTVTPAVAAEAIQLRCQLIVSHHPVLFRGAKSLTSRSPEGRLLLPLLANGIAVLSHHTAFDNAAGGINDWLAAAVGLDGVRPLRLLQPPASAKLVVYVPEGDLDRVSQAIFDAGAGHFGTGKYRECSFLTPGTGTFFAEPGSNPTIGEIGRREQVPELRLEAIVPKAKLQRVLSAMVSAHSYEEPAFDVYPLDMPGTEGEGRIGELPEARTPSAIAGRLALACKATGVKIVGDRARPIRRVAIACGAAGEFLKDAIAAGAEAFVTGEVRFHEALAAEEAVIGLIVLGHYASERPAMEQLAVRLQVAFPGVECWASECERDPLGDCEP